MWTRSTRASGSRGVYSQAVKVPERLERRYEGKAKVVYATSDPERYIVEYKDDATAFNAQKRGQVKGKGAVNNAVSAKLFRLLEARGVKTHFVQKLSEREQLVRAVTIIPLEVVVRPYAAGSFAARYGTDEGGKLTPTVLEWCYKSDALGDPPLNDDTALALGLASAADLATLRRMALEITGVLTEFFGGVALKLIDLKLEFGRLRDGEIILADEISPDTCRLWDTGSGERLDKDRFRRDLGGVEDAYQEVARRVLEG
jgi:phosphoribosylaminoimidazole-succinocarboxamide synthase